MNYSHHCIFGRVFFLFGVRCARFQLCLTDQSAQPSLAFKETLKKIYHGASLIGPILFRQREHPEIEVASGWSATRYYVKKLPVSKLPVIPQSLLSGAKRRITMAVF